MNEMTTSDNVANEVNGDKKPKLALVNAMEEIVMIKAKSIIAYDKDACKCERCLYDICAIALNALNPRYYTSVAGELYARVFQLETAETMQISVQIAHAMEIVRKSPSHKQ